MFCANGPFVENILFMSLELLQSGVEGKHFPVAGFFDQTNQTLAGTVGCFQGEEELHANNFAICINGRELRCSDYVGRIHSDLLKSETVS